MFDRYLNPYEFNPIAYAGFHSNILPLSIPYSTKIHGAYLSDSLGNQITDISNNKYQYTFSDESIPSGVKVIGDIFEDSSPLYNCDGRDSATKLQPNA